ncbi:MAG TPA: MarR family transcriptional regulator [Friedmanniella sp.]
MGPDERPATRTPLRGSDPDELEAFAERTGAADGPPPFLRLDDQLCFALYSATNAVVRAYRPLLKDLGLTYPQYLVMMALWEQDDISLGDLAARLDLPLHGLSPVLERLDQAGLLARLPDPSDRRVSRVSLTPAGQALEQQAALVAYQVRCHTELAPDGIDRLRQELHELNQRISRHLD